MSNRFKLSTQKATNQDRTSGLEWPSRPKSVSRCNLVYSNLVNLVNFSRKLDFGIQNSKPSDPKEPAGFPHANEAGKPWEFWVLSKFGLLIQTANSLVPRHKTLSKTMAASWQNHLHLLCWNECYNLNIEKYPWIICTPVAHGHCEHLRRLSPTLSLSLRGVTVSRDNVAMWLNSEPNALCAVAPAKHDAIHFVRKVAGYSRLPGMYASAQA